MARPTARVLALLEILQTGGTRTVADLAARVGVDERTLRRYVEHLLDLGVPVESVRGRYGGYRLVAGYKLPPLMLTDDEALAVLLGLLAGRRTGLSTASMTALESASAKVRRVLPTSLAARLESLLETVEFTSPERPQADLESDVLLRLAHAARNRRPVHIDYSDRTGRRTSRTLHPYGIVAHHGRWYVSGEDSVRAEVRTFRLDRIADVRDEPGTFSPPEDFDAAEHLLAGISRTRWRHEVSVRVLGEPDEIVGRLPRGIASVESLDDGWARVRLRAERLDWVPGVLVALDAPFVIEAPDELRSRISELAARLTTSVNGPP
jgi:predicted DNA-binding transcriptional regulator YafY